MTADSKGDTAFCLTLQTREQHIRRSSASSNICTNEALTAVAAAVYVSAMGAGGMINIAKKNMERAKTLIELLSGIGVDTVFDSIHFNEFAVKLPKDADAVNKELLKRGVMGGVPLKGHVNGMNDCMLIATTEMHSDDDHKKLIDALKEVL